MAHPFEFLFSEWQSLERKVTRIKGIVQNDIQITPENIEYFKSQVKHIHKVLTNLEDLTLHHIRENNQKLAEQEQDNVKDNPGQS